MNTIYLTLCRNSGPALLDYVQGATAPDVAFILSDYEPDTNATARIFVQKSEKQVYNSLTLQGNVAVLSPKETTFDEAGHHHGQLEIVSGGKIAYSYQLHINVHPNIIDSGAIEAQDDFSALQDAIIAVGDMEEAKTQIATNTSNITIIQNDIIITDETKALYKALGWTEPTS